MHFNKFPELLKLCLENNSESLMMLLDEFRQPFPAIDKDQIFNALQYILPKSVLISCPKHHSGLRFISDNCANILGFSKEQYIQNDSMKFLFARIHNDDLIDLEKCYQVLYEFTSNQTPNALSVLRCIFHYRFKTVNRYIVIRDEKMMLKLYSNDNLFYSLLTDVTPEYKFSGARLDISSSNDPGTIVKSFKPGDRSNLLTHRELKIVQLLKNGLSLKEAAGRLGISYFTARNIKQNIFSRFRITNLLDF